MKKLINLAFAIFVFVSATAQNIPIDFEESGNGADWTWTTFENDSNPPLEIIPNPDPSGINTSSTVAKFTALQSGQPFAGCESLHGAGIGNFTIDESNSIIRIMVWKPVISDVGIKLVTETGWSKGELKVANTKVNEWEQLTFDFSTVDHENMTYDQIVIFPDFSSRESDNIIYFDGIYGEAAMPSSTKDLEKIEVRLFPNPATDAITIQSASVIRSYEVYSVTGEVVAAKKSIENPTINISDLPKGIYLLRAFSDEGTVMKKFIKG
ncbi:MAG: T9SS type A sorting domain-containing protein [Phaeodactylibacter sp.]|uniref:T9SS type A sorting domain-containing protein n=1 Tax=Phaeodactylibacter sp. TaxID=1940289 RepID=UPI0032EF510F